MANWTVQEILDYVQELVGEPAGSYYNLSTRLKMLNQAQREMVRMARGMRSELTQSLTSGQANYYYPFDFGTFNKEQPYVTDSQDNTHKLQVVDVDYMDRRFPGWRDGTVTQATPQYLIMLDTTTYRLYPVPDAGDTLTIPYTPQPTELTDLDDVVFDGLTVLDEFALGLAYKVAGSYMMPRAPQLGRQYLDMYEDVLAEMRLALKTNPQHHQSVRPTGYRR